MGDRTGLHQRLADEQPARACLDSDMDLLAGETGCPPTNGLGGSPNAATLDVARPLVESVESDLRSMHEEYGEFEGYSPGFGPSPIPEHELGGPGTGD
jgi:hypothetical protein